MPTEMEDYLFDLRGYIILEQALPLHSGAHKRRIRTQFRYHDGFFGAGRSMC